MKNVTVINLTKPAGEMSVTSFLHVLGLPTTYVNSSAIYIYIYYAHMRISAVLVARPA